VRRGDVFWADLGRRSGSEQTARRPVVIVSHDGFNQTTNWRSIIVVPVSTSELQSRRSLTIVPLPLGAASLPRASAAICHQVTTLDRSKLSEQVGSLSRDLLKAVDEGLKAALDLE